MRLNGITSGARVAVAMSGGVDSSVAALLLKEAGFDVFGVTMTLWSCHSAPNARKQTCCSTADVADARAVCERLGIPHTVADFRTEFRRQVIDHFSDEYARGRTPIPCIGCNQYFKFDRLWAAMQGEFGADYLATGHYSQIARTEAGEATALLRGIDPKKDQSYYLFVMTPAQLQHSLFPLGAMTKAQVRAVAQAHDLETAQKPESFEICFVPDNDYARFIEDYYPDRAGNAGAFVNAAGATIGRHHGTHAYTIGQRRGLGLQGTERQYVTAIDVASRRVTVGSAEDLLCDALVARDLNWLRPRPVVGETFAAMAKIRAMHTPARCRVEAVDEQSVRVQFVEPQSAITPGQAVVLYEGEAVLGGGWIC